MVYCFRCWQETRSAQATPREERWLDEKGRSRGELESKKRPLRVSAQEAPGLVGSVSLEMRLEGNHSWRGRRKKARSWGQTL